METKALRSKMDNISVQLYAIAKEIENEEIGDYTQKFVGEMLKNISFQMDTMIEFLD